MSDVVDGIVRLLHGAYGDGFHQVLLFFALHFVQHPVERAGHFHFVSSRADFISETCDKLVQVVQFVGVGEVVYAVGEHFGLSVFGHFPDVLGHRAVSQKHELFDELVRFLRFFEVHVRGLSVFVYFKLHFRAVEVDRAFGHALLAQELRQPVQLQNFFHKE